jgi:hypothetical protein
MENKVIFYLIFAIGSNQSFIRTKYIGVEIVDGYDIYWRRRRRNKMADSGSTLLPPRENLKVRPIRDMSSSFCSPFSTRFCWPVHR